MTTCNFPLKTKDLTKLFEIIDVTTINPKINVVTRARVEEVILDDPALFAFLNEIKIIDTNKLIDLVSLFLNSPERDSRLEELQTGGNSIINYEPKHFKKDVFALLALFVSIVLLYISYLRCNDFFNRFQTAHENANIAEISMDKNAMLILRYFISLIPGCSEGNFQMEVITKVTSYITTEIFKTTSLSLLKAKATCYTSVSSDPTLQLLASTIEHLYDTSAINSCMTTIVTNDMTRMVMQFTEDVNIAFNKANGAINFMLMAVGMISTSSIYLLHRIKNKPPPVYFEIESDLRFKTRRVPKLLELENASATLLIEDRNPEVEMFENVLRRRGGRSKKSKKTKGKKNRNSKTRRNRKTRSV